MGHAGFTFHQCCVTSGSLVIISGTCWDASGDAFGMVLDWFGRHKFKEVEEPRIVKRLEILQAYFGATQINYVCPTPRQTHGNIRDS